MYVYVCVLARREIYFTILEFFVQQKQNSTLFRLNMYVCSVLHYNRRNTDTLLNSLHCKDFVNTLRDMKIFSFCSSFSSIYIHMCMFLSYKFIELALYVLFVFGSIYRVLNCSRHDNLYTYTHMVLLFLLYTR